jgi:hypothetical protein
MLRCSWGAYFSAAALFRKVPRQHEFGFEHRAAGLHAPIKRCCPAQTRMPDVLLHISDDLPGTGLVPAPVRSSVTAPSWTTRLPDKSSGSTSPRFSFHSRTRAALSSPMMIRASEPPMKYRRSLFSRGLFGGMSHLIRRAFEAVGVEFIDENGGGPGVRLQKRRQK